MPLGLRCVPDIPSLKYRQPCASMTTRSDDSGHHGAFLCPLVYLHEGPEPAVGNPWTSPRMANSAAKLWGASAPGR